MVFYIISEEYLIPIIDFQLFRKYACEPGLLFVLTYPFPELVICLVFLRNPTTKMCASTVGSFQVVGNQVLTNTVKHTTNRGFMGFASFGIYRSILITCRG